MRLKISIFCSSTQTEHGIFSQVSPDKSIAFDHDLTRKTILKNIEINKRRIKVFLSKGMMILIC